MAGPQEPQYPGFPPPYPAPQPNYPPPTSYPGYPGYQPQFGYPAAPPSGMRRVISTLAERTVRRPEPRLGVSLAGVGIALAIIGVVVWGGSYLTGGSALGGLRGGPSGGNDSRRFLGVLLCLVVVVIGYLLAVRTRQGPLATAGVTGSAFGIPVLIEFLTFSSSGGDVDAVILLSVLVWLGSYLLVPGARGHTLYLGLSAYAIWLYILDKTVNLSQLTSSAISITPLNNGSTSVAPQVDFGTLAGVSLSIGAIYYAIAYGLDRTGHRGAGVAFVLVGFPAVAGGLAALADDVKEIGTGLVLIVVGAVLAAYGSRYGRRFTTWTWAIGMGVGAVLILAKLLDTAGGAAIGISLIVLGAIFVAGGWALARALNEPPDVVISPSP